MANCIKRNCSAFPCAREHNVLEEWLDDHGKQMFWVVDVKTFFDVAICHVLDREIRCKCNRMYHKCDYCISITPGLYSAFYFSYKNKKRKEVVTDVKIEFTHTSGGKGYCFEADIYKTKQIEQEEQRSQYLSDYNFD